VEGLGINLPSLLAQIVNFLILLGLLYLVAYKPVMRMLDERSRRIKESMDKTEEVNKQADQAEQEMTKRIAAASDEGQKLVEQAVKAGGETRRQAQLEAKKEADGIIARARAEIKRERDEAVGELRREFADLAVLAAGKVIDRSLDKESHRQLIEKVLKESSGLKQG
jgi:F-type H+-transporting ATPase subunit b